MLESKGEGEDEAPMLPISEHKSKSKDGAVKSENKAMKSENVALKFEDVAQYENKYEDRLLKSEDRARSNVKRPLPGHEASNSLWSEPPPLTLGAFIGERTSTQRPQYKDKKEHKNNSLREVSSFEGSKGK